MPPSPRDGYWWAKVNGKLSIVKIYDGARRVSFMGSDWDRELDDLADDDRDELDLELVELINPPAG